jgi:hypothetical protein
MVTCKPADTVTTAVTGAPGQPVVVPLTVYVVVLAGDAFTIDPVVALRFVLGVQV